MLTESYRSLDLPNRRISHFNNGLTGLVVSHDAAPIVSVRVYVRCGSVFERDYLGSGISHLLEHLITCDGAGPFSESELLTISDEMGGLMNAYTSIDHICYYSTAPVDSCDRLTEILSNYVIHPRMSREVFDRELGVVQRELERDRDDPDVQLEELIAELAYRGHPMCYPIIGHRERLVELDHAALMDWYARTHSAENAIAVIVGAIDVAEGTRILAKRFSGLRRGIPLNCELPRPQTFTGRRIAVKQMDVESASNTIAWQTVREGERDDVVMDLLSTALLDGDESRFSRRLRWESNIVFDIGGTHDSHWHTPGTFSISAQFDHSQTQEVIGAVLAEVDNLKKEPVTKGELERARQKMRMSIIHQRETAEGLACQIGEDFFAMGDSGYSDLYLRSLESVNLDDLANATEKYLVDRPFAHAMITPKAKVKTRRKKITISKKGSTDGLRSERLDNGATLVLRNTDAHQFVAVHVSFRGGLLYETAANNGGFNLLTGIWPRGAGGKSADEIAELFADKGSAIRASAGLNQLGIGFVSLADDASSLLDTFGEVLFTPDLDQSELEKLRPTIIDAISRQEEHWGAELTRFARQRFFDDGPWSRSRIGTEMSVSAANAKLLENLFAEFASPSNSTVSVAGAVDRAGIAEALRFQISTWQAAGRSPETPDVKSIKVDGDRLFVKQSPDHREVAGIFIGFPGIAVTDIRCRAAVSLIETMLAGYSLSSGRLFQALRSGNNDLAYEVSSVGFAGLIPGYVAFAAGCEPDRVSEVYRCMRAEIDEIRDGRFDDREFSRAKAMIRMGELDQLQTAHDLAVRSAVDSTLGLGENDADRFMMEIESVSGNVVREIAADILRFATVCIATPEPNQIDIGIPDLKWQDSELAM